jgi:hypothetical protein
MVVILLAVGGTPTMASWVNSPVALSACVFSSMVASALLTVAGLAGAREDVQRIPRAVSRRVSLLPVQPRQLELVWAGRERSRELALELLHVVA